MVRRQQVEGGADLPSQGQRQKPQSRNQSRRFECADVRTVLREGGL